MTTETRSSDSDEAEVVLDVRPIIERGEEPFATIMETVAGLDGRDLLLVAPFEPTPLQGVLSAQGFTYESNQHGDAEWQVRFSRTGHQDGEALAGGSSSSAVSNVTDSAADGTGESPAESVSESASSGGESPFTIRRPPSSAGTGSHSSGPSTPGAAAKVAVPGASVAPGASSASAVPFNPAAMAAMNPTLNVPPAWLPLGFMAAAGVGLIAFGIAAAITASSAVDSPRSDHVIAAVHFAVLGFLSTAVLGAMHQFGPVVGGKPLRSIPAGVVTGVLFVPGVWIIPLGFATGHNTVVQVGGVMATTAVCIAAWNASRPLSARGKGAPIIGLRLAVIYLVVTAAFGVTYAFDRQHFWFPLLENRVLAHAHIGLLGWLGLAYIAVAEKLWPMFLLAHRPHAHEGERAVWLVGIGAPVATVGLLFAWKAVAVIGGAVVVVGLGHHLASLASVIRHRRRNLELLHGFVLVSAACLVIGIVLGVVAGLAQMGIETRTRLVSAEVTALIMWLALAVIGHAHKIVPFISWNRLRDRGITKGRDGRPLLFAHLVNAAAARVALGFALAGAVSMILGMATGVAMFVGVGGVGLALAGLAAMSNLVSGPVLMIRWHAAQVAQQAADSGGAS
ncbi:MAG: DUF2249 domain-containing protein [Microthrixaceae bacterium]